MYFSLLLLLCSVSTGQPEAQQLRQQLREITASLAEQKAKIAFLEKENQGTASCQVVREVTASEHLYMTHCCVTEI